ncbi:protein tyrosine kinase domain-containing protein [Ditylenchus destructor]|nr:protein tyrosine kinase domain-containing protein [Ditylenchus destructor]
MALTPRLKHTSLYSSIGFIIVLAYFSNLNFFVSGQYPTSRNGPPRFKQNARSHQYAYLGDNVKLQCKAIGRPQPKVHWYREGAYLNYSFMQAHPRFREKSMSLEIRRIEVGDKGNWMCRVWNNEGSTTRNFTLHIVDFCDYFLNLHIEASRIPEECMCQWATVSLLHSLRDGSAEDVEFSTPPPGQLLPPFRGDLDLSDYNSTRCAKFEKNSQVALFPRPSTTMPPPQDFTTLLSEKVDSNLHGFPQRSFVTHKNNVFTAAVKKLDAKIQLASKLVKESAEMAKKYHSAHHNNDDDEDYDDEEEEGSLIAHPNENRGDYVKNKNVQKGSEYPIVHGLNGGMIGNNSNGVKNGNNSTVWPQPPTRVAPYFRQIEEQQGTSHMVLPAGRTLKLTCKAGGQPEPQVDDVEIHRDSESKTGSLFKIRKWVLELEDAAESDSGQVISDLVPHIVWIKLVKMDGSFIKWDPKTNVHSFNFVDMSTIQSMANATLTVNEFRPMTLPTENPYSWPISYTILLALSILLTLAFLVLSCLYFCFSKRFSKQRRVQNLDKMSVRKKVVITRKPQKDGDMSDFTSTYAITVEPIITASGELDQATQAASEVTLLSDYEVPTDAVWEIDRNRLNLLDILGEGAFGEVWRGMLRPKYANENDVDSKNEVSYSSHKSLAHNILGDHPNILKLIGCCTGLGPLMVVLELCPHGNLRDFLRQHRPKEEDLAACNSDEDLDGDSNSQIGVNSRPKVYQNVDNATEPSSLKNLTLRDLVQYSLEVARGMEFLASRKIIHRDLAARNVLVSATYEMKISDFGLSRNVIYHDYYRKRGAGRLPIKWMAPEALEANVYTVYSDVWSYGTPYPSIAMPQLYNILKEGYRMEAPHNCPDEIYSVMVMCWQDKAEQRPQFKTIADYFDWMLTEAANYRSDDGETTDEGPYAMINETPDKTNPRKARPFSAPGTMSFEIFASRDNSGNSKETEDTHKIQMLLTNEREDETDDENCPLLSHKSSFVAVDEPQLSPPRKKSSLLNQLHKQKVHSVEPLQRLFLDNANKGTDMHLYTNTKFMSGPGRSVDAFGQCLNDISADGYLFDSAIGLSPLWSPALISEEYPDKVMQLKTSTLPRMNGGKNMNVKPCQANSHEYVNDTKNSSMPKICSKPFNGTANSQTSTATTTANSSTKSLSSSSSSSGNGNSHLDITITHSVDHVKASEGPSHMSAEANAKKSVVSDPGLRVNGVSQTPVSNKIAQQTRKNAVVYRPTPSSSNQSNLSGKPPAERRDPGKFKLSNEGQRSRSMDSTTSSGHGGSSAMSSAEGLGAQFVEYITVESSNPMPKPFPVTTPRREQV